MILLCISLVLNDVEHLLMCLSTIYVFYEASVKNFLHTPLFFTGWFAFLLSCRSSHVKFLLEFSQLPYGEHIYEEFCTLCLGKTHNHISTMSQIQCQEVLPRYTPAREEVSKRCFYFTMTSFYLYPVFLYHQTGSRRTAVSLDVRQIWVQIPTSAFNPYEREQPGCHFSSSIKWINLLSGLLQGLKVLYMQDLECNKCLITFTNVYSTL